MMSNLGEGGGSEVDTCETGLDYPHAHTKVSTDNATLDIQRLVPPPQSVPPLT